MNILDHPDLKKGEQYGTYAYRLLDRSSTVPLRLVGIYWTGAAGPEEPPTDSRYEEMTRVGMLRKWPLITRVEARSGRIAVTIEGRSEPILLLGGDQITIEVG